MGCICFLLFPYVLCYVWYLDFLGQVTECCQYAIMEVNNQTNPVCQRIGLQTEDKFPSASGVICRTAAELCCVKHLQENLCGMGKSVALYVHMTGILS